MLQTLINNALKTLRVLVVEDNPYDARLIQEMLKDAQIKTMEFEFEYTHCLSTGLLLLEEKFFDAVLLDLHLPDDVKFEALNSINHYFPHIPIVVLSTLADQSLAIKAVSNGAQDYIVKGTVDGNLLTQSIRFAIERMKVNEKLRWQKEELSEFAHIMSHDIRSFTSHILGYSELLSRNYDHSYIVKIKESINSINSLLKRSLELADAGLQIRATDEVDLTYCVKSCAEYIIPESITFFHENLSMILCDREKVYQIFKNLFENAVIHGEPTKIEVREKQSMDGIILEIMNDGRKIHSEIREKIFLRWFSTKKGNKGLGLNIVKKLIDAHGWKIILDNGPQTTFRIFIPNESVIS
ncbi:MAG: ATP-binding response regulator [Candidatus Hodarchaeales archaeon]|jgi:signal transduction histidine kinase